MAFTLSRMKEGRNISYIYKIRRCTAVNSYINISESNNLNASNSDNDIVNQNLPHINVQNDSPFNTLITFQK